MASSGSFSTGVASKADAGEVSTNKKGRQLGSGGASRTGDTCSGDPGSGNTGSGDLAGSEAAVVGTDKARLELLAGGKANSAAEVANSTEVVVGKSSVTDTAAGESDPLDAPAGDPDDGISGTGERVEAASRVSGTGGAASKTVVADTEAGEPTVYILSNYAFGKSTPC